MGRYKLSKTVISALFNGRSAGNVAAFFLVVLLTTGMAVGAENISPAPSSSGTGAGPGIMELPPVPLVLEPVDRYHRVPRRQMPSVIRPTASVINVNFLSSGTLYGNTCTPWPATAQTAFSYAAGIWEDLLDVSIPITVDACWAALANPNYLGIGGGSYYFITDTWYPYSLANQLLGSDLNGSTREIGVVFNSTKTNWYFGTDGNPGSGNIDFVSVVLHEICHGLGFAGSMKVDDGAGTAECAGTNGEGCWGGSNGYPFAYDRFAVDQLGHSMINTAYYLDPSIALGDQLKSGNVFFNGANAVAANGGVNAELYAPATWASGSSYAHLDEVYNGTPNALMTYSVSWNEANHDPGSVTLGILEDIGWTLAASCTYSLGAPSSSIGVNGGAGYTVSVTAGAGCAWTAVSNNGWISVTGGSSGSGSGTVTYSVQASTAIGNRSGTITIAGQVFTVNQTGCTYALSPSSNTVAASGTTTTFSVTTNGTSCAWTPTESLSWVSINSGSGPGSGTVSYTVAVNSGSARSGNINVADKTFIINQSAPPPPPPPVASFKRLPASGSAPLLVAFTDCSTGKPASWLWDFGDGETSTLQNPEHTYRAAGTYNVTLIATNAGGSSVPYTCNSCVTTSACGTWPVYYNQYRSSIKAAYADIPSSGSGNILTQAVSLTGDISFFQDKVVKLWAGYDCGWNEIISDTRVVGSVTVSAGQLVVQWGALSIR